MPRFAGRKVIRKELGRPGQARSGRLGGISKPLENRKGTRPGNRHSRKRSRSR